MSDVSYPVNRDGKTAISRIIGLDDVVKKGEKTYKFVAKNGVSIAWVDDADVVSILAITKTCGCAGGSKKVYTWANSAQVAYWERS